MLFDLRSPARRRMIKVIYTFLALLMAVGLVGFGIGGATSGGIFDVSHGCGGSGSSNNTFKDDVDKAQKRTLAQPTNPGAWAALTRAQYQLAATHADQSTGAFTAEGHKDLLATDRSWKRYLTLTEKPDPNLASLMVQAYAGLGRPKEAVKAQQIVTSAKPNANAFYQLAVYAYAAKDNRTGDLASQRALDLTPPDLRPSLKERLKEAKTSAQQPAGGGAAGGAGGGTATPVSPTG